MGGGRVLWWMTRNLSTFNYTLNLACVERAEGHLHCWCHGGHVGLVQGYFCVVCHGTRFDSQKITTFMTKRPQRSPRSLGRTSEPPFHRTSAERRAKWSEGARTVWPLRSSKDGVSLIEGLKSLTPE